MEAHLLQTCPGLIQLQTIKRKSSGNTIHFNVTSGERKLLSTEANPIMCLRDGIEIPMEGAATYDEICRRLKHAANNIQHYVSLPLKAKSSPFFSVRTSKYETGIMHHTELLTI